MEEMRNQLSMSEQELQIEEIICKIKIKSDTIENLKAHQKYVMQVERAKVGELANKTHMIAEAITDKINVGLLKKYSQ
jgi:hypothetical protein